MYFSGRKIHSFNQILKKAYNRKKHRPQMALEQHAHLIGEETEAQRDSNLLEILS